MIAVGKRIIGPSHCKCWANWNGLSLCEKWNEDGKKLVHGSWISTSVYPLKWNEKLPLNVLTSLYLYTTIFSLYCMSSARKELRQLIIRSELTKNLFAWQRNFYKHDIKVNIVLWPKCQDANQISSDNIICNHMSRLGWHF